MNWGNWGKIWEIDHKRGLATFDLFNKKHLKK